MKLVTIYDKKESKRKKKEDGNKKYQNGSHDFKRRHEGDRRARQLYSQLRPDIDHLLNAHGSETPDPTSYKGILGKSKSIWDTHRKELVTTLTDSEEEPVEVRITSEFKNPQKSTITVHVQGIKTYLHLPKEGGPFMLYAVDNTYGKSASLEDLTKYQDVLNKVKEKFEPTTQPSQPNRNTSTCGITL